MRKILTIMHHLLNKRSLRPFFAGALLPFGFAPFHLPGCTIIGLAFLFYYLSSELTSTRQQAFRIGLNFGLGYFGCGVSWVFVSIHQYGHLNSLLSGLITILFIAYLAVFLGGFSVAYTVLKGHRSPLSSAILFSALWCLTELARSTLFTGFPWLLVGFGQMDTPLKALFPIIGVYGVGFITCLCACFLAISVQRSQRQAIPWLAALLGLLMTPLLLENQTWTDPSTTPVSVGVIQANLSMRDKWDEAYFLKLLAYYKKETTQLLKSQQLIVMPESAIPAPDTYVSDFLETLHQSAQARNASILLGIPEESSRSVYYNALISLGNARGAYQKKHLVPFGEFNPKPFQTLMNWLSIPAANMTAGPPIQTLVQVDNHPIATLICYELAYPSLLRSQLPEAEWIVSISDDGWFGHSYAIHQQLQMAQVLSRQTGRYQIVANNDGLSSIVDFKGTIIRSLPAYQAGILKSKLYPATGASPWVTFGDTPIAALALLVVALAFAQSLKPRWIGMRSGVSL